MKIIFFIYNIFKTLKNTATQYFKKSFSYWYKNTSKKRKRFKYFLINILYIFLYLSPFLATYKMKKIKLFNLFTNKTSLLSIIQS